MSRTTGTGVLVLGVILGVIGAIMYWAVTVDTTGFNINTAGLILFWVGVVTAIIGLVLTVVGGRSTVYHEEASRPPVTERRYEEEHRAL
jgi:hypothetical protein